VDFYRRTFFLFLFLRFSFRLGYLVPHAPAAPIARPDTVLAADVDAAHHLLKDMLAAPNALAEFTFQAVV
jgi:hypothetical protein